MALVFWDASSLIKRYFPEVRSEIVDSAFEQQRAHTFATTAIGYAETYASLVRRLNGGHIGTRAFATAISALQSEVLDSTGFEFVSIDDATVFSSTAMVRAHNLNATDAAILTSRRQFLPILPRELSPLVLVASDRRLLRAAEAEGITTLNPEASSVEELLGILAPR